MVIVDTDVFIATLRGNKIAEQLLRKYKNEIALSLITEMELWIGAKNDAQKNAVSLITQEHPTLSLTKQIGIRALKLVKQYNSKTHSLNLADAIIAASCIENKASLITFNTKDFKFIKGLHLAK